MRWIKTTAWLTLAFWTVQSIGFIMLFASIFTRLIIQCFGFVGLPVSETSMNTTLTGIMKVLSWPVRPIFESTWSEGSFIVNILLLALNSLIWASVVAAIFFFVLPKKLNPSPS